MKAKQAQLRFQIQTQNLSKQFDIYQKSTTKISVKLHDFQKQLKKIKRSLDQIQTYTKLGGSNIGSTVTKQKRQLIKKYQEKYNSLISKLQFFILQKEKKDQQKLFQRGNNQQSPSMTKNNGLVQNMDNNIDIAKRIRVGAYNFNDTTDDIGTNLIQQRRIIQRAGQDVNELREEAGTIDRLMRIVKNKQLLNKVILLSLAIFIIFADIVLLALKL